MQDMLPAFSQKDPSFFRNPPAIPFWTEPPESLTTETIGLLIHFFSFFLYLHHAVAVVAVPRCSPSFLEHGLNAIRRRRSGGVCRPPAWGPSNPDALYNLGSNCFLQVMDWHFNGVRVMSLAPTLLSFSSTRAGADIFFHITLCLLSRSSFFSFWSNQICSPWSISSIHPLVRWDNQL